MKMLSLLFVAAFLGGCALMAATPQELREKSDRIDLAAAGEPVTAANCIARRAENAGGTISASVRPVPTGNAEVVVRSGDLGSMAVFDLQTSGSGSYVRAYIAPLWDQQPDQVAKALTAGC